MKNLRIFKTEEEYNQETFSDYLPYVVMTKDDNKLIYRPQTLYNSNNDSDIGDWVDLGLPSGTLWASYDLGAKKKAGYGNIYMWGQTGNGCGSPSDCSWQKSPLNGGYSTANETVIENNKKTFCSNNVLIDKYDAAYQLTKGEGRMPTMTELMELFNNTIKNLTIIDIGDVTPDVMQRVNAIRLSSKINNKSIIIPAIGYWSEGERHDNDNFYMWTSFGSGGIGASLVHVDLDRLNDRPAPTSSPIIYGTLIRPVKV